MQTEAPEPMDELPEDFAAAWATVLLDLWEKRQSLENSDVSAAGMEGTAHGK